MRKRLRSRLLVTPPTSDGVQERVERRLLHGVASGEQRAPVVAPPPRARTRTAFTLAVAVAGVAAAMAMLVFREHRTAMPAPVIPLLASSTIATGPGQGSRVTLDQVIVQVGADTHAAIRREADGATVLDLARGSLDCDVAPRRRAAPFRVRSGAITVAVLGTRFSVWRIGEDVRVDVIRGRVSIASPSTQVLLGAGETWSSGSGAPARAEIEVQGGGDQGAPTQALPTAAAGSPGLVRQPIPPLVANPRFARAQGLEPSAPDEAVALYRELAAGRDAWAALSLYSLADLESRRDRGAEALRLVSLYERRFPRGANAEDISWLRVETLRRAGARAEAHAAASAYLTRHPSGTYAPLARRLVAEGAPSR
jgi:hypothetical protein